MKATPAFQFYPGDFLAVIATFSLEEIGAYSALLGYDWTLNGLPVEAEKLARLLRVSRRKFDAIWSVIGGQFPEAEGRRHNPGLQLERAKQAEWREKSRKGGVKSGEARTKGGSRVVEEWCEPNTNTSTSSSSPVTAKSKDLAPRKAPSVSDDDPRFAALWAVYPRRSGGNSRADAFAAFRARIAAGVDFDAMFAGTERYAAWIRAMGYEGTSYVKQGKTFLGPGEHWLESWDVAPKTGPTRVVAGSADDDAIWSALQDVVAKLARNQLTADEYRELPKPMQAGLRAVGGWSALRDVRQSDAPFRRRDFLAAYHAAASTQTAGAA